MAISQRTPVESILQSTPSAEPCVKRILVALAGETQSDATAIFAAGLVQQLHAEMILLNVFPTGYSSGPDIVFSELEHRADCIRDATALLESIRSRLMPDLKVDMILREGEPSQQIVKAARDCGADLIVIGAPAHGWLTRTMLGSVTHSVVHHASCPVLTVPFRPPTKL